MSRHESAGGRRRLGQGQAVTRRQRSVLGVGNCRRVYEVVVTNPGISYRELAQLLGMALTTVRHHVTVLVRYGWVLKRRFGASVVFFDAQTPRPDWRHIVALRSPELHRLLDTIGTRPGRTADEIHQAVRELGWSRSLTRDRLDRLEHGGVIHAVFREDGKAYWPTPPRLIPLSPSKSQVQQ